MQANLKSLFLRRGSFAPKRFASQVPLNELDQKDTTILKALAILAIVFHNFFHVAVKVHESEFDFDPTRFGVFLDALAHPSLAIQALFAFYGHIGVQNFIILSA